MEGKILERLESLAFEAIRNAVLKDGVKIESDTPLIGSGSVLDSMKLVEVCLVLEDVADEEGFEFDWTSESAMSRSKGIFRTAGSLVAHFCNQGSIK